MPDQAQNHSDPNYAGNLRKIAERLKTFDGPIYIVAHEDPDGDAIGSVLGLSRALVALGKTTRPIANCPRYLEFLTYESELLAPHDALPEDALLCVLDCGDISRATGAPTNQAGIPLINIDHHGTNNRFGELALVDPAKPATALMIKELVDQLGLRWNAHIALPTLTGIITDTGSFRYPNTTPEALHAAADLLAYGASLAEINEALSVTPKVMYPLKSRVLETIRFPHNGLVVTAHVNATMLAQIGADWEDVESLVSEIRGAEGTTLAMLFKDKGDSVKISLRSRLPVSAQNIALALGGGGHVVAAGASVKATFEEVYAKALAAAETELKRVELL